MIPFTILAFGALFWIFAALAEDATGVFVAGLVVLFGGFAGAAAGVAMGKARWIRASLGVASLGAFLFLWQDLGDLSRSTLVAGHVFAIALTLWTIAIVIEGRTTARLASATIAITGLVWAIADVGGGLAWEPGDLAILVGAAWATAAPDVPEPASAT